MTNKKVVEGAYPGAVCRRTSFGIRKLNFRYYICVPDVKTFSNLCASPKQAWSEIAREIKTEMIRKLEQ
jgi:hypothetical protein